MLLLKVLRKVALEECRISSGSFRHFIKNSNGQKSTALSKIQPPSVTTYETHKQLKLRSLFKPFIFTICFSSGAFACSTIWQYENMRKKALRRFFPWSDLQYSPTYKKWQFRQQLNNWWMSQTQGQKVALAIISMNLCVFLFWRIRPLQSFMQKYFCSSPANKAVCLPMFLSTFSHYSFFHLAANMYVLYSFSSTSVAYLGPEQFVALYCSAGVISSFTSYLHKVITGLYGPSLGASGAIMTILSLYCMQFPDNQLALIFFPFFTLSAGHALKGIMALDVVGIFAKWKVFDHAAHLGGSCLGIFYFFYGGQYIWGNREYIMKQWHNFRTKDE